MKKNLVENTLPVMLQKILGLHDQLQIFCPKFCNTAALACLFTLITVYYRILAFHDWLRLGWFSFDYIMDNVMWFKKSIMPTLSVCIILLLDERPMLPPTLPPFQSANELKAFEGIFSLAGPIKIHYVLGCIPYKRSVMFEMVLQSNLKQLIFFVIFLSVRIVFFSK